MPQTKVEKKFFQERVKKRLPNFEIEISESVVLTELQKSQTNIAGGAE